MHRNERHAQSKRRCLCKIHPDQQGTDQTGRIGDGNCIDFSACHIGALKSLLGQSIDRFTMLARGNLRNNATVDAVQLHLRRDTVRQDLPAIAHKRNISLVAGGFHR